MTRGVIFFSTVLFFFQGPFGTGVDELMVDGDEGDDKDEGNKVDIDDDDDDMASPCIYDLSIDSFSASSAIIFLIFTHFCTPCSIDMPFFMRFLMISSEGNYKKYFWTGTVAEVQGMGKRKRIYFATSSFGKKTFQKRERIRKQAGYCYKKGGGSPGKFFFSL